jgi:hypothetical protein
MATWSEHYWHSCLPESGKGAADIIDLADHKVNVMPTIRCRVADAESMMIGIGETPKERDSILDNIGFNKVKHVAHKPVDLRIVRRLDHSVANALDLGEARFEVIRLVVRPNVELEGGPAEGLDHTRGSLQMTRRELLTTQFSEWHARFFEPRVQHIELTLVG